MREFLKKNFAIVLAFALPIALIAIIALSTYLPSLFLSTDYNFIYSSCREGTNYYRYDCSNYLQKRYSVVNGRIAVNSPDPGEDSDKDGVLDVNESYTARIFLHDTKENESREITSEEAEALTLSGLLTSPDGITVSGNYDRGADFFFLFDGGSSYGYYLTKGRSRSKLNLISNGDRYYYQGDFQFIGWVLPGRS
ncbi:MAG: hypothetical protein HY471_02955 [Candidatus Sungbacteria bacterium]|nr:hypothetical protein [Candidatus Sungbacteria bacterium]